MEQIFGYFVAHKRESVVIAIKSDSHSYVLYFVTNTVKCPLHVTQVNLYIYVLRVAQGNKMRVSSRENT